MKNGRRIVVIASTVIVLGLGVYAANQNASVKNSAPPIASTKSQSVVSEPLPPDFANFPAPTIFKTFTYEKNSINGSSSLLITAQCTDSYITLLIFSAKIDYRANISRAIYNRAMQCTKGDALTLTLASSDLGNAPYGDYYYFTAAQGMSGLWYNPK